MDEQQGFSDWLRLRRRALDLTRDQLAASVGYSSETLKKIEAGDARPSRKLAEALASALKIPDQERDSFIAFARGEAGAAVLRSPEATTTPWVPQAGAETGPKAFYNLPNPLTALIGRTAIIEEVAQQLRGENTRLLTLTGPPGTGKTRLSIAVANQLQANFPQGLCFVELAPISDAALVAQSIAAALGLSEKQGSSTLERIQTHLRDKAMLLILDNFEQVIDAGAVVSDILKAAPNVKAITSSREPLHLYGEREYPVPPLSLPASDAAFDPTDINRFTAIMLFMDRASAVSHGFRLTAQNGPVITKICAAVDGLPLAIEMAAAQIRRFSPQQLLTMLQRRLAILIDGPRDLSPRQRTLRGAIDWSWDLLNDQERAVFCNTSAFSGGCTEEALTWVQLGPELAQQEASLADRASMVNVLDGLVDKSLVRCDGTGTDRRYWMLNTIGEYAREKLESGPYFEQSYSWHAQYFLNLGRIVAAETNSNPEMGKRFDRVEIEINNLRAAMRWAFAHPDEDQTGLQLASHYASYWVSRHVLEGRAWLEQALRVNPARTAMRAQGLVWLATYTGNAGDQEQARASLEEALAIIRPLDDPKSMVNILLNLGELEQRSGDFATALDYFERALQIEQTIGRQHIICITKYNIANAISSSGDHQRARELFVETLVMSRKLGLSRIAAYSLLCLSGAERSLGRLDEALAQVRESLDMLVTVDYQYGFIYAMFAWAILLSLKPDQNAKAAQIFGASEKLRNEAGIVLPEVDRKEQSDAIAQLKVMLGEDGYAAEYELGQRMSVTELLTS